MDIIFTFRSKGEEHCGLGRIITDFVKLNGTRVVSCKGWKLSRPNFGGGGVSLKLQQQGKLKQEHRSYLRSMYFLFISGTPSS